MPIKQKNVLDVIWTAEDGKETSYKISVNSDHPILDLSEAQGVNLPHGCRSGSCGSCRIEIIKGMDLLSERSFLEQDTLERHHDEPSIRLSCRTRLKETSKSEGVLIFKTAKRVEFKD